MVFLTCIFFALTLLITLEFVEIRYRNLIFFSAGILLFCIAAFRPPMLDKDYASYLQMFESNLTFGQVIIEPSFILISTIVHNYFFSLPFVLFFFYAAIAVTVKLVAIQQLSGFKFLSLLVYFSYSFLLNDMTQIRAGVSVGFILLSLRPLYERKAIPFLIFALMAFFFHYSAIVVFFIWFLSPNKINTKIYAISLFVAYGISIFSNAILSGFVDLLPDGVLLNKLIRYEYENGTPLNIFNAWQLMRCLLCFIFLWKIELIWEQNRYAILLVKLYVMATLAFVLLASNPTFAGRISDLFSVVDIVMLPCLLYIIKPKQLGALLVIIIAMLYFILNVFYNSIFL